MPEELTGLIKDISILIAFIAVFCTAFSTIIVAKIQSTTQLKVKAMDLYFDSKLSAYREFIEASINLMYMFRVAIPVDEEYCEIEAPFVPNEGYWPKTMEAAIKVSHTATSVMLLADPALAHMIDSFSSSVLLMSQTIIELNDNGQVEDKFYKYMKESGIGTIDTLIEKLQEDLFKYDYKRKR